jgi:hypothetical protein
MTDRSEPRDDDRTEPPTGEQTDAEPVDEQTDAASTESIDGSDHLDDVADGAGCAEIWERLSERREAEQDA